MNQKPRVFIMAAGTGGHIYPALEVARVLTEQGIEVHWLGTAYGLEQKLVKNRYKLHELTVQGMRKKTVLQQLKAVLQFFICIRCVKKLFRLHQPSAVIGFGGYISGSGGIAAVLSKIPLIIHEQNAVIGTANKILTYFANRVLSAFPNVHTKAIVVGNPVRAVFTQLKIVEQKYRTEHFNVLIVGGSLGALAINTVMPQVATILNIKGEVFFRHQSGPNKYLETVRNYRATTKTIAVEVVEYIEDMAKAFEWAHCIICRAGAMTVSEIMAAGLPAIYIPLPTAVDDHQTKNAKYAVEVCGSKLLPQASATASAIAKQIAYWHSNRKELIAISQRCKKNRHSDSTKVICHYILSYC